MTDDTPFLCSRAALQALKDELAQLETEGRAEVARRFEDARNEGAELTENAAYQMALLENDVLQSRIAQLQDLIARAVVPRRSSRRVAVGSIVTVLVRAPRQRAREERFVVDVIETVPNVDLVSPASPMGAALLDTAVGDEIVWDAPAGRMRAEVVSIETPRSTKR